MTLYFLVKYLNVLGAIPVTKAILVAHGFSQTIAAPFAAVTLDSR
jgi:hypothetical protein